jgi:phosphohistidine phosphatase
VNVYLVQHAEAKSKDQDPDRPLTSQGRREAESVAAVAARLGLEIAQIRHSGKTRARQTAEVMAERLSPSGGVVTASGLAPLDDVKPVAEELATADRSLMLVGHLPFMERLAGYMLTGDVARTVVQFRKAGIVNLERKDGGWQVQWIITPDIASAKGQE